MAFDKSTAKRRVRMNGIRTPESRTFRASESTSAWDWLVEQLGRHGKVVLKPARDGSSYGLRIPASLTELRDAVQEIQSDSDEVWIAEPFLAGVELTVGVVLQRGAYVALPPVEIRPVAGRAFDYAGKYLGDGVQEICPAEIDDATCERAQAVALAAHRALGCSGYSRTDMIVAAGEPWFLETNTLPGLTSSSLLPQELRAAGIGFGDFLAQQLELAAERRHRPAPSVPLSRARVA